MKMDERLTKLEKQVLEFRIVVAGGGAVHGGFGELTRSNVQSERISNLQRSVRDFSVVGDNMNIAGNFDDGFVIL